MIAANKEPILDALLYFYFGRLIKSNFHAVYIRGLEHYRGLDPKRPTLCFANHCSWWDGMSAFFLTRFNRDKEVFCMMEEKQLKHYRFFTWIGAFSVDLSSQLKAATAVRYALDLMRQPESLIWIFPQGKFVPPSQPMAVKEGTAFMANHAPKAQLLPVIFRYEFFSEQRPMMLIHIGPPYSGARPFSDESIREALQREMDLVDTAVRTQNLDGFQRVTAPALSINKRWEWIKRAFKGDLKGFRAENG